MTILLKDKHVNKIRELLYNALAKSSDKEEVAFIDEIIKYLNVCERLNND